MSVNVRRLLSDIDWWAHRMVAWPMILIGAAGVMFFGGLILFGAYVAGIPTTDDEEHS